MLEVRAMDMMTPKSPEPESETPTRIQPAKPISFSNGIIKRHHHHHHVTVTYKECLKNHAAAIGGHALDGCGEFMPSLSSTPSDPTSLKCAACGCHRNFHRRDPDDSSALPPPSLPLSSTTTAAIEYQPHHRHHPPPPLPPPLPLSPSSSSPPPISSSYMLLALSGNNKTVPFSDLNFSAAAAAANNHISTTTPGSRKRFRTKFSSGQKEKMHEFADRIGWKIQKRDEDDVREFCREIGVDKGVLKVWMHNNKNTFKFPGGGVATVQRDGNGVCGEDDAVRGGSGLGNDEDGGVGVGVGGGGRFESDSGGADGGGNVNASSSSS
ncbi:PREDICTED: zinc-finger homeodomain protein 9-like [Camelina sativa]|uniref:Zinc-finger homeodomain protein 9-like n=1 Tax=Camelina sativa TaxID=90675 RepID=A0ABM0TFJ8_CAMSA|nr:PREDICTED: zinc-finger homeodomain protein 9-like [Camelina sativa]